MLPHSKSSCGRLGASTDGNIVMLKLRHIMLLMSAATSSSNFKWLERAMAAV